MFRKAALIPWSGAPILGHPCETDPRGLPETTFLDFAYSSKYVHRNQDGSIFLDSTHLAPVGQFLSDAQSGTLPSFSYIEAGYGENDEHPGFEQSILAGQQQVARLVNGLMASPSWADSVFFFSYDEGGGPFDHVPPVPGHTNDFTNPGLGIATDIQSIAVQPDAFKPCPAASAPQLSPSSHCDLRTKTNSSQDSMIQGQIPAMRLHS